MRLHSLLLFAALAAPVMNAAPVLVLDSGGDLQALAGATTGWGFTLTWTSDDQWFSVTGSALENETNPFGTYIDYVGPQGGPLPYFALGPGSDPWVQPFNDGLLEGAGAYVLDSNATPFAINTGLLTIFFDVYDGNPMEGGQYVESSQVSANFSVQVQSDTPEPSMALPLAALVLFAIKRKR